MTSQLQKQFFDTFGIEPKCVKRTLKLAMHGYDENDLPEDLRQFISSQAQVYHVYPQITDRILLHLLSILNNYGNIISSNNIKKLEDEILIKTITLSKDIDITPQVRALFSNK